MQIAIACKEAWGGWGCGPPNAHDEGLAQILRVSTVPCRKYSLINEFGVSILTLNEELVDCTRPIGLIILI